MNPAIEERVKSKLRATRLNARLSQEQVGSLLDPPVPRQQIWAWESGRVTPRVHRLKQLASALGVSVDQLL